MLATLGGPPPMQQVGLADSDPIEALWAKLQEKMKLPEDREACDKISDHCISEWAMVTVSCLKNPALLQQDVLDILAIANKPKWLRTLEFLLDHRYPVLGAGVPPSAALAQSGGEVVTCPTKVERFPTDTDRGVGRTSAAHRPARAAVHPGGPASRCRHGVGESR